MLTVVRISYQLLVEVAGILKEARNGTSLEIVLNVLLSIAFVSVFGIIGVVMGGFAAAVVRTIQFAVVSCQRALRRSVLSVVKNYAFYFILSIVISFVVQTCQRFITDDESTGEEDLYSSK